MNLIPMLAAVSGEGMVRQMQWVLIVGTCLLILWWVGKYLLTAFGASPDVIKIWNALFVLLGAFALINFLLSLIGYPLVKW